MQKLHDFFASGSVEAAEGGVPVSWLRRKGIAALAAVGLGLSLMMVPAVALAENEKAGKPLAAKSQANPRQSPWADYGYRLGMITTPQSMREAAPEYPEYRDAMICLRAEIIALVACARDDGNTKAGELVAHSTILESFLDVQGCIREGKRQKFLDHRWYNWGEYLLSAAGRLHGIYRINEFAPTFPPIETLNDQQVMEMGELVFASIRPSLEKFNRDNEMLSYAAIASLDPAALSETDGSFAGSFITALEVRHHLKMVDDAMSALRPGEKNFEYRATFIRALRQSPAPTP